jgi:hypothetical protein
VAPLLLNLCLPLSFFLLFCCHIPRVAIALLLLYCCGLCTWRTSLLWRLRRRIFLGILTGTKEIWQKIHKNELFFRLWDILFFSFDY